MNGLKEKYVRQVVPAMRKKFGYRNDLAVPKLLKVSINSGTGSALQDEKLLDSVVSSIARIAGQHPVYTKARKSISAFKVREGMTVGVRVTLRGAKMLDFVEKIIKVTLPRVRDFQGISQTSVDTHGNLTIGFKEHIMFPEIRSDEVERIFGLQVTVVSSAKTREEGLELFTLLGVPFKKG